MPLDRGLPLVVLAVTRTDVMNYSLVDDLSLNTTILPLLDRLFSNTSLGHRLLERLDWTNLRHAFYLVSPYETAVRTLEEVPNYNVEVSTWWFIFLSVEFLLLFITGHDDRIALNDTITSVCAGMLSQCFKFGGRTVAIFLYVFIWNNLRVLELPWDSPWTWLLCLFLQDFLYYLGHRAVHEAGFFWGLHTIHHSSEYYNFSTALRQAAVQDAGLALYDVLQAFFIPPPIFLVHRYFSEIFQFIMHTSLIGSCGPLGLVFNTPSHHRVHHGRNPYCIDRNYGGVFIIWDRMFGTFEAEREDDPPIYGLIHNENTFNQLWLQFHTLIYMLLCKGHERNKKGEPLFPGLFNKMRAALYPPGWYPGVQTFPFFHWFSLVEPAHGVPEVAKPVVKYNPRMELWLKGYLFGHFVLLLAVFFHFEYDRPVLSYLDFSCKMAFFVVSMQTFGAFFDNLWYAPALELLRCAGVLSYYFILMLDEVGAGPHRVFITTVFALSALSILAYSAQQIVSRHRVEAAEDDAMRNKKRRRKGDTVIAKTEESGKMGREREKEEEGQRERIEREKEEEGQRERREREKEEERETPSQVTRTPLPGGNGPFSLNL